MRKHMNRGGSSGDSTAAAAALEKNLGPRLRQECSNDIQAMRLVYRELGPPLRMARAAVIAWCRAGYSEKGGTHSASDSA